MNSNSVGLFPYDVVVIYGILVYLCCLLTLRYMLRNGDGGSIFAIIMIGGMFIGMGIGGFPAFFFSQELRQELVVLFMLAGFFAWVFGGLFTIITLGFLAEFLEKQEKKKG